MNDSIASGSLAMVQPAWHRVSGSEDYRAGVLYQTSLMSALIAGLHDGDTTYREIRKHGDFGLGTFNDLDGEMVGFDGTFYQLRSDGSARPVTADQKTPFAVVTFFRTERELDAEKVFTDVQGTLAGFRTPTYAQGIGVAGFHLHFLLQDKQAGGHALDYRIRAGKVQICTVHDLQVELPESAEFLKTNFEDQALNEKIKASEGE